MSDKERFVTLVGEGLHVSADVVNVVVVLIFVRIRSQSQRYFSDFVTARQISPSS